MNVTGTGGRKTDNVSGLEIRGEPGLEMPLRVLNLAYQLGLSPGRIVIESCLEEEILEGVVRMSVEGSTLLVEKLRSMVLVRSVVPVQVNHRTVPICLRDAGTGVADPSSPTPGAETGMCRRLVS